MPVFSDPKVECVFQEYAARAARENERLGTVGFEGRDAYLLPVGEEAGRFLASLIRAKKPGRILEIGTSYGYSTLFLASAARDVGAELVTLELIESKQAYAKEKIEAAGLSAHVEFRLGDAIELIQSDTGGFDFALLDIWKELYVPSFHALYPKLSDEGIIAADNMYFPSGVLESTRAYRQAVQAKSDLQTTLLPIGSGIELTCKWSTGSEKL